MRKILLVTLLFALSLTGCPPDPDPVHTHSYSATWSYDATQHWRECSCGKKTDGVDHTAGIWIVDQAATATTTGSQHKECTACGYVTEIETIPIPHTHTYSDIWSFNTTQHWKECTANDGAKSEVANHTGTTCSVCGYDSSNPSVTFGSVTANGSATATTTTLTLTFSTAITGFAVGDITLDGVAGVQKGTLNGSGPTYTLGISGFTVGGTLTVAVAKYGYNISGSPKTVPIYYYTSGGGSYNLGDTGPGGGIIFYVDTNGFTVEMVNPAQNYTAHYLEAAPADMATTFAWASSAFLPPDFGGTGNWTAIPGTATGIGAGRKNTALILATDADAPAAKACNDYSNGGKTDWFLPSKDELERIYRTPTGSNMGTSYWWWSSSQYANNYAWSQDFGDGKQYAIAKHNTYSVRAVRAF